MKVLKISPDLVLPADDAVVRQFAWLGRTGSGKVFTFAGPSPDDHPVKHQAPPRPARKPVPTDGSDPLGAGERRILEAIAMFPERPARVGFVSGYVPGGSTYRKYVSTLRSAGLVEREALAATSAGHAAAGNPVPPGPGQIPTFWRSRLGAGERKIFDAVVTAHPHPSDPAAVAEMSGFELGGSTWRKYVSTLRSLGLLVRGRELRAAPELFA